MPRAHYQPEETGPLFRFNHWRDYGRGPMRDADGFTWNVGFNQLLE